MPEALLDLSPNDIRDILQAGASNGPWVGEVLEKDVWVVWCLDALFRQPAAPEYAFTASARCTASSTASARTSTSP